MFVRRVKAKNFDDSCSTEEVTILFQLLMNGLESYRSFALGSVAVFSVMTILGILISPLCSNIES